MLKLHNLLENVLFDIEEGIKEGVSRTAIQSDFVIEGLLFQIDVIAFKS